ncbi:MAG: phosphomannose isomerase type II C-terminal cupin domain [Alphaproteobacteria bacterium]|nr:phosphomannose isomerase type II C-terminal cupin domain [Alphaproteobacteria bacterium]MBP3687149.1 phosphomannose isomerase type II C-terminal cupin domain [Alphaproteobacteria bacterium]
MSTNYKKGDFDTRPWGTWEVLDAGEHFCVKRITVNPQAILSLQLHHFRAEHWIIAEGEAMIVLGEDTLYRKADDSVYIPVKTKHRIKNTSLDKKLVFIEIQTGETLDESDIVRFEDNYGRSK